MTSRKDQQKVGIPQKRRGQQTGFAGNPDQNRQEMEKTPALRGRRKGANKMFADKSSQHVTGDAVTPRSNSPSTPAVASTKGVGESGGERAFKQRLGRTRRTH
jgi:hypothetical protein